MRAHEWLAYLIAFFFIIGGGGITGRSALFPLAKLDALWGVDDFLGKVRSGLQGLVLLAAAFGVGKGDGSQY